MRDLFHLIKQYTIKQGSRQASKSNLFKIALRSTGEGTAADLAARFGLDIRQRGFWESSLQVIERRIERYRTL